MDKMNKRLPLEKQEWGEMSVLLYIPTPGVAGENLQNEIGRLIPAKEIETCRTKEELSQRLCEPREDLVVGILLTTNKKEFLGILSLRELLQDFRIILLLPDREKDTIAKGYSLRPRFLGYADTDLMLAAAILGKMFGNARRDKRRKEDEKGCEPI